MDKEQQYLVDTVVPAVQAAGFTAAPAYGRIEGAWRAGHPSLDKSFVQLQISSPGRWGRSVEVYPLDVWHKPPRRHYKFKGDTVNVHGVVAAVRDEYRKLLERIEYEKRAAIEAGKRGEIRKANQHLADALLVDFGKHDKDGELFVPHVVIEPDSNTVGHVTLMFENKHHYLPEAKARALLSILLGKE